VREGCSRGSVACSKVIKAILADRGPQWPRSPEEALYTVSMVLFDDAAGEIFAQAMDYNDAAVFADCLEELCASQDPVIRVWAAKSLWCFVVTRCKFASSVEDGLLHHDQWREAAREPWIEHNLQQALIESRWGNDCSSPFNSFHRGQKSHEAEKTSRVAFQRMNPGHGEMVLQHKIALSHILLRSLMKAQRSGPLSHSDVRVLTEIMLEQVVSPSLSRLTSDLYGEAEKELEMFGSSIRNPHILPVLFFAIVCLGDRTDQRTSIRDLNVMTLQSCANRDILAATGGWHSLLFVLIGSLPKYCCAQGTDLSPDSIEIVERDILKYALNLVTSPVVTCFESFRTIESMLRHTLQEFKRVAVWNLKAYQTFSLLLKATVRQLNSTCFWRKSGNEAEWAACLQVLRFVVTFVFFTPFATRQSLREDDLVDFELRYQRRDTSETTGYFDDQENFSSSEFESASEFPQFSNPYSTPDEPWGDLEANAPMENRRPRPRTQSRAPSAPRRKSVVESRSHTEPKRHMRRLSRKDSSSLHCANMSPNNVTLQALLVETISIAQFRASEGADGSPTERALDLEGENSLTCPGFQTSGRINTSLDAFGLHVDQEGNSADTELVEEVVNLLRQIRQTNACDEKDLSRDKTERDNVRKAIELADGFEALHELLPKLSEIAIGVRDGKNGQFYKDSVKKVASFASVYCSRVGTFVSRKALVRALGVKLCGSLFAEYSQNNPSSERHSSELDDSRRSNAVSSKHRRSGSTAMPGYLAGKASAARRTFRFGSGAAPKLPKVSTQDALPQEELPGAPSPAQPKFPKPHRRYSSSLDPRGWSSSSAAQHSAAQHSRTPSNGSTADVLLGQRAKRNSRRGSKHARNVSDPWTERPSMGAAESSDSTKPRLSLRLRRWW